MEKQKNLNEQNFNELYKKLKEEENSLKFPKIGGWERVYYEIFEPTPLVSEIFKNFRKKEKYVKKKDGTYSYPNNLGKPVKACYISKNFSDILRIDYVLILAKGENSFVIGHWYYNFGKLEALTKKLKSFCKKREMTPKSYHQKLQNIRSEYESFINEATFKRKGRIWYSFPGMEGMTQGQRDKIFDFMKLYMMATNSSKEGRGGHNKMSPEDKENIEKEKTILYQQIRKGRRMDKRGKLNNKVKKQFSFTNIEWKDVLERSSNIDGKTTGNYVCNPKDLALRIAYERCGYDYPFFYAPRIFKVRQKTA